MAELFPNWTHKWLFKQILPWQSGEQSATRFNHQRRGRENLTHKCVGTTSNKTGSIYLNQREKSESYTLSDGQQGSLVLPFENEGNKERMYDQIEQTDLALSSITICYHRRIRALNPAYSSRQGIKKKEQILQSGFFIAKFFKLFFDY